MPNEDDTESPGNSGRDILEEIQAALFLAFVNFSASQLDFFANKAKFERKRLEKIAEGSESANLSTLIKIAVFLEFANIKTPVRDLSDFDVSFLEVYAVSGQKLTFFLTEQLPRESFLRLIRGVISRYPEHTRKSIQESLDYHRPKQELTIVGVKQEFKHIFGVAESVVTKVPAVTQSPPVVTPVFVPTPVVSATKTSQSKAKGMKRVERFRFLHALYADLVEFYLSSSATDADREELRRVIGQENLFDLKNNVARLCGATAFKKLN